MPALRKSRSLKALQGTLRADRQPRNLHPGARLESMPRPPARLSAEARPHWTRIGKRAIGAGILRDADLEILAMLAEAMATIDEAQELLRSGIIVKSRGAKKANPALHVLRDARAVAVRLLLELGLSPRAAQAVDSRRPRPRGLDEIDNDPYDAGDGGSELRQYIAANPSRRVQ